jgi:hypothetical protein
MLETFDWPAFFNAEASERAKMAREVAAEAEYLARVAYRSELRRGYLNLQRELTNIADQIESTAVSSQPACKSVPGIP